MVYPTDHLGFSGTREGMSEAQLEKVKIILDDRRLLTQERWLHHGLCIGADTQMHHLAKALRYKIWGHPPIDRRHYCVPDLKEECDYYDAPYSYHGRNQRILVEVRLLIATPLNNSGKGGTWWTINCARRMQKPRIIIHRDGSMLKEEGN